MDLRVKKTLINIQEAFFNLRKKKSLEKITVKELSETAMINKATFYLHYKDIYDLSDKMKEKIVEHIVCESLKDGFDRNLRSFMAVTENLLNAIYSEKNSIKVLFSGADNEFIMKLERKMKNRVFELIPELKDDIEKSIIFSYMLHGLYNTSLEDFDCSQEKKHAYICNICRKVWV